MPENSARPAEGGIYDGVEIHPLDGMVSDLHAMAPGDRLRFRQELGASGILEAAATRRRSDTLIITFHGALDREKYQIPRFERARMTETYETSCLYWADPSLWLDESLALAWYTGAGDFDLFALIAERSLAAADALGATRIIFTGSSGGGFAALQTSALVPGSTALVFNPQTAISRYWETVQRKYLQVCQPAALPGPADEFDFSYDWSERLDDRFSAVRRYESATGNRVHYWTNTNDWHHTKHFRPFRDAVSQADTSTDRLAAHAYKAAKGHHSPSPDIFREAMERCLAELDARS